MVRFAKGMVTGMLVGAAVEMSLMSRNDRKTKRNMKRAGRKMRNIAELTYNSMHHWMR